MYEIRSYNERLHPDLFLKGGVLGFCIRLLNFLRWKLEVFVQYLAIRFMLRQQKFSLKSSADVLRIFTMDVAREKAEYYETSPLRTFPLSPLPSPDKSTDTGTATVEAPAETNSLRGESLENLFLKYAPRNKKKRGILPTVGFDQFQPVLSAEEPQDESVSRDV